MWWVVGGIFTLIVIALVAPQPPGRRSRPADDGMHDEGAYADPLGDPVDSPEGDGFLADPGQLDAEALDASYLPDASEHRR